MKLECSEDVVSGQNKELSKLDVKWITLLKLSDRSKAVLTVNTIMGLLSCNSVWVIGFSH